MAVTDDCHQQWSVLEHYHSSGCQPWRHQVGVSRLALKARQYIPQSRIRVPAQDWHWSNCVQTFEDDSQFILPREQCRVRSAQLRRRHHGVQRQGQLQQKHNATEVLPGRGWLDQQRYALVQVEQFVWRIFSRPFTHNARCIPRPILCWKHSKIGWLELGHC